MQALHDHFNVAEADKLKTTSERAMMFETFLMQCQKVYSIYEKEGQPMTDEAKV